MGNQGQCNIKQIGKTISKCLFIIPTLFIHFICGKRTANLQKYKNIKTVSSGSNPSKLVLLAVATFLFNNGWAQTWLKFLNQVLPVYSSILCTWYSSMTRFKYILNQCRSNEFLIVGLVRNIILRI